MEYGALGIDIGGTFTKYALVDAQGHFVYQGEMSTTGYASFEAYLTVLHREITCHPAIKQYYITTIGIGAPKGNQKTGCIEEAFNLMRWGDNIPVVELVSNIFGKPAFLLNDANAAAYGEKYYGQARGLTDFVVVTLGTGLGCGIFCNDALLIGNNSAAGELGHVIAERDGRYCTCGRQGCLETYVSGPGIVKTMRQILTWKREMPGHQEQYETSEGIAKAAAAGDSLALKAFEYTGKYFGRALADIAAIFDPQAIILSGGVARAGEVLMGPARKHFAEAHLGAYLGKVSFRLSNSDNQNMAVLGAVSYALTKGGTNSMSFALGA